MALPRFFCPLRRVGERGGEEWKCAVSEPNPSARSSPACPRCPRLLGKGGVHSPEMTSRKRKSNRFTLSNWAAHASKAVQCDVVCICERRIMFDSGGKLSQQVRKIGPT